MLEVWLVEEYGYRTYIWETPFNSEEELVQAFTGLKEVQNYYFSSVGLIQKLGGKVSFVIFGESPYSVEGGFMKTDFFEVSSLWNRFTQNPPLPSRVAYTPLSDKEVAKIQSLYIHLHDEDDSYLRIGDKFYRHRGYTKSAL